MMTSFVILEFTNPEWLAIIGILIVIFIPLLGLFFRAGQLTKDFSYVKGDVTSIKDSIFILLTQKLPEIEKDLYDLKQRKYTLTESPKYLNELGKKILKESNIRDFVDKHYEEIVKQVKDAKPENSYQAELAIVKVIRNYKIQEETRTKLEEEAFKSGTDVSTLLFVASIDIRDKILNELGFPVEDIDKHAPKKKTNRT